MRDSEELHVLDEYLNLKHGTIYSVVFAHTSQPDEELRSRLQQFGIEFKHKSGSIRKECRPSWQSLMQKLEVHREWWLDPSYWDVPSQDIPNLEDAVNDLDL